MKTLSRILVACAVPLLGIIIALGILELVVRLLGLASKTDQQRWDDRPAFYFRSPKAPTMQDYPYEVPKPLSTFRIAAIGDSFTFAPYMQFTDTYVKKLESMLNLQEGKRDAQVINYGVPAYSTSHEIAVVQKAINEGADLILLQITLNDPEIKRHTPMGIRENMDDRFGALSLTGTLGTLARHWKTLQFALTRIHNTKTHRAYVEYFNDLFHNPRTWNPFVESMLKLVETAKSSQRPIVAVVFPLFGLPMTDAYPFYEIHTKVRDLMQGLAVPILDLSTMYKGIPLERLQVIPGVDRHPNEIAHRMAAEKIYLWLEQQGIIPEAHRIQDKFATRLGIDQQRAWQPVQVAE
jgi:hypothetical protein